jgi:hypothetical protein
VSSSRRRSAEKPGGNPVPSAAGLRVSRAGAGHESASSA